MPTIRSDLFYPANIPAIVAELVGVYGAGLPSETLDDITTKTIQAFPQGGDPNAVRSYAVGLIQGAVAGPVGLTASSLDTSGAGTLTIGGTNATGIVVGKAGVPETVPGGVLTSRVDTAAAGALSLGNANATSVVLGTAIAPVGAPGGAYAPFVDAPAAGPLAIGGTTATSVVLGRAGFPVNVPGVVSAAASPIGTVAAIYNQATGQLVANLTTTVLDFETVELDTDAAVTVGVAWKFTCPAGKGGLYLVTVHHSWAAFAAAAGRLVTIISKNAIDYWVTSDEVALNGLPINTGSAYVVLAPTDTIQVKVFQNSGVGETTINAAGFQTRVCIVRMAGS